MRTLICILIVTSILVSCGKNVNKVDSYAQKEDSLICQLIDSLILPDSSWRKHLLVPPPLFHKEYSKSELKKQRDSLLQKWDTAQLYIAFDDSLLMFSSFFSLRNNHDTLSYFKYNLENLDSTFYSLFKKCLMDTTHKARQINAENFKTHYNYKLIDNDSVENMQYHDFKVVEIHHFSRIIFDDNFDRACFCQASICGRLCGGGYMIFLEKKFGKWRIVEKKMLWVS